MPLAISMYSYHKAVADGRLNIASFIHEAARVGAQGVELLDFYYKDRDADRESALEALQETGLPVPIFSVSNNFAKQTSEEREIELGKITRGVDEALHFGAEVVRVFAGDVSEHVTFDQAREWIVEGLALASHYAAERGVKLALENHGSLAGRGEQVRSLIEDVRAKSGNHALGANPDTGNFLIVGQPSHEAIAELAHHAYMVHFKDFVLAAADYEGWTFDTPHGERLLGACVGEGIVDLASCVSVLRHAGFAGWFSLEYEGVEDPMTAVPRSFTNAIAHLGE